VGAGTGGAGAALEAEPVAAVTSSNMKDAWSRRRGCSVRYSSKCWREDATEARESEREDDLLPDEKSRESLASLRGGGRG
jgi:hypothetical protein